MADGKVTIRIGEHPSKSVQSGKSSVEILAFKDLLFDLSTRFIDLSPRSIKKEINRVLRLVGEFWKFDRIILASLPDEATKARATFSYTAPGVIQHFPEILLDKIPSLVEKIQKGDTVSITPLTNGSGKTKAETELVADEPIQPGLFLPVMMGKVQRGLLIVNSSWTRSWSGELIGQLHHLNRILAGAVERWKTAEQIREIEDFEHLLSEISATYINLPARELEKVLKKDFAHLNKLLGVDVSILYLACDDTQPFQKAKPLIWFLDEAQESNRPLKDWLEKKDTTIDADSYKYLFAKWNRGEATPWKLKEKVPGEAAGERQGAIARNIKSSIGVPIRFAGSVRGVINIATTHRYKELPEELIPRLRLFGEVFINALMRKESEEKLEKALCEIKDLKKRIEADYIYLREEVDLDLERDFRGVVGKSDALKKILIKIKQVAPTRASVLLLGETGTGKGLLARAIHNASDLRNRPLMQINCAALAPNLVESELFGHEKGAFTGASNLRLGRFESARGTTLFLDEIGELPLEQQPKLLRVLEEGEFERVGGSKTIHTDARVIAATSRDLEKEVTMGKFRQDLWFRLNIFPIFIPPLRSRLEDIPLFVAHFVEKYGKWAGKKFEKVPVETIKALQCYHWPGNIRELRNTIEKAVITSLEGNLRIEIPETCQQLQEDIEDVKIAAGRAKREQVLKALQKTHWVVEGPSGAARLLGLSGSNLRYYIRKFNLKRPANT